MANMQSARTITSSYVGGLAGPRAISNTPVFLVVVSGHCLVALSLAISVKPILNWANVSSRT